MTSIMPKSFHDSNNQAEYNGDPQTTEKKICERPEHHSREFT